jgi:Zn-dependent protease
VAAVFISILVHELGHALTMRAYGFYPWITLYAMGGLASYSPNQVVRGRRGLGHFAQVLISLAGPGAGFVLAAVIMGLLHYTGHHAAVRLGGAFGIQIELGGFESLRLFNLVADLLDIGIFWGLINLLPVYPLDGGHIAQEVLSSVNPQDGMRQSLMLSVWVAVLMAGVAVFRWHDFYLAIFFGYLAYSGYSALQAYLGRGPW